MKIVFGGHEFILHYSGALIWPARSMLIAADLHLEKGSHYARRGYFLPPYDSRDTLERLLDACAATQSENVMILGDGFHDSKGFDRLEDRDRELFMRLSRLNLLWIKGNHDRDFIPSGASVADYYERDGIVFRHEAGSGDRPEISGHFHPKIDITHKGGFISCRCFVEDARRLILPAFGAYAGGLEIGNPAYKVLFSGQKRCYAISREKIYLF